MRDRNHIRDFQSRGRRTSLLVLWIFLVMMIMTSACFKTKERVLAKPVNWEGRFVNIASYDSLANGSTYLSVYSEIYTYSENDFRPMTATISMRNTNRTDTVFANKIEYFNTHGTLVKSYIDNSIFIAPMETVEIVIGQMDLEGGTGANFYFDWAIAQGVNAPFFEGIMVSHTGAQAFSFVTQGQRVD